MYLYIYIDPCLTDYTVIIRFENGSSVSYTVDAATLFVSVDEPEGAYSVMVVAINGAGEGQVGTPTIDRKLQAISYTCRWSNLNLSATSVLHDYSLDKVAFI